MHKDLNDKNDRLFQFIDQHKNEFEEDFSSDDVWNKINARITKPNQSFKQRYLPILKYVAAALFLMILGASIWGTIMSNQITNDSTISLAKEYNPEYANQLVKFAGIVEERQEELKKISTSAPVIYKNFSNDLNELEAVYKNLKQNLYNNPNKEDLIIALIENLEMQADVLNQQLAIIKKIKNKNHEVQ